MSWLSVFISNCTALFSPRVERSPVEQQRVDRLANSLTLYTVNNYPQCRKLSKHLQELNVSVTVKDLKRCHIYEKELFAGGGKAQVPCLRVEKGSQSQWIYEFEEIVRYLDKKFAPKVQLDKIGQAH